MCIYVFNYTCICIVYRIIYSVARPLINNEYITVIHYTPVMVYNVLGVISI